MPSPLKNGEEYLRVKKMLDTPGAIKDDARRTWAIEATQAFEDDNLAKWANQLDPQYDLVPQALATQPATTDPRGDKAAADDWVRSGGPNPKGVVYVYEPPTQILRRQLLDDPSLVRAIRPKMPPKPEEIVNLKPGDPLAQDASNYLWRQTADAAAKAGKTAYRYSKAPWLHGEGSDGIASQLKLKLSMSATPLEQAAEAYVMGVDNTALFGLGRAAQETLQPTTTLRKPGAEPSDAEQEVADPMTGQVMGKAPPPAPGPEIDTLGIDETKPQPTAGLNAAIREDNPIAFGAGQVTGAIPGAVKAIGKAVSYVSPAVGKGIEALAPWSASNELFDLISRYAQRGLQAVGVTGKVAPVVAGAASGALAGAGVQAAQEGVDMGAHALQTGEAPSPERLAEAGERIKDTGLMSGAIGGGAVIPQQAARAGAEWFREGRMYRGQPGRFERLGGEIRLGEGPVMPPEVKAATDEARARDYGTPDVMAEKLAPKIERAADEIVQAPIHEIGDRQAAFFASPEGQKPLPFTNAMKKSAEVLGRKHQPNPTTGALEAIGIADKEAAGHVLTQLTDRVSLEPVEGAIALPLDQAVAYLPKEKFASLAPKGKASSSGARELSEEEIAGGGPGEGIIESLKRRGVKQVYLVPRGFAAEQAEEAIKEIGELGKGADNPNTRIVGELKKAAYSDRDARPMNGQKGGWSAFQAAAEKRIREVKDLEARAAPKEGGSYRPIVDYATQHPGELLNAEALRKAADKAGVREQLEQVRSNKVLKNLQDRASFGPVAGKDRGFWSPSAWQDWLAFRFGYPIAHAMEGATGPIGMGKAGRAALVGEEPADQERRKSASERRVPNYTKRREVELDRLYPRRHDKKEAEK